MTHSPPPPHRVYSLCRYFGRKVQLGPAYRRQKLGLVWRNRKKNSQIINDYLCLPFFLFIILWPTHKQNHVLIIWGLRTVHICRKVAHWLVILSSFIHGYTIRLESNLFSVFLLDRELSSFIHGYTIRLESNLFSVFLLDRELNGAWAAIIQNTEVKG